MRIIIALLVLATSAVAQDAILAGSVDVCIPLKVTSSVDGSGMTGIAHNASGLTCSYYRDGAAGDTSIPLVAGALNSHSDGGWAQVDATAQPGVYRLCLPDAVVATGARYAVVLCEGVADMLDVQTRINIWDTPIDANCVSGCSGSGGRPGLQ